MPRGLCTSYTHANTRTHAHKQPTPHNTPRPRWPPTTPRCAPACPSWRPATPRCPRRHCPTPTSATGAAPCLAPDARSRGRGRAERREAGRVLLLPHPSSARPSPLRCFGCSMRRYLHASTFVSQSTLGLPRGMRGSHAAPNAIAKPAALPPTHSRRRHWPVISCTSVIIRRCGTLRACPGCAASLTSPPRRGRHLPARRSRGPLGAPAAARTVRPACGTCMAGERVLAKGPQKVRSPAPSVGELLLRIGLRGEPAPARGTHGVECWSTGHGLFSL